MTIRNWWITAEIDGRESTLNGGPRSKDGGFYLTIKQRANNTISTPLIIEGKVDDEGVLTLFADYNGEIILKHRTKR